MSYQSLSPSKGAPMAPEGESHGCQPRKACRTDACLPSAAHMSKNRQLSQKKAPQSGCQRANTL